MQIQEFDVNRRDLLIAATSAVGSAALLSAPGTHAARKQSAASDPRHGPYVEIGDGTQLFVRDWGAGKPIVFLSGWSLPSDIWSYQMAPLSEQGFRCIAYDRRGHGRSSDPGRGFDYDTLADDLFAVLEALDVRGATIVAHSMAGGEVVRYLTRHGATRVTRVALVGSTLPFLTKTADNPTGLDPAIFEQTRQLLFTRDFPSVLQANLRPFLLPETPEVTLDWVRSLMLQCSLKAALDCNRALAATDFRKELAKIATPLLVIHGDNDQSAPVPLTAQAIARIVPAAALKIYEGAPHGLMLTHATQLTRDLSAFIG